MGHQLTFYATNEDLSGIEQVIRDLEPVTFVRTRSPTSSPATVPGLTYEQDGKPWLFFCLVREVNLSAVLMRQVVRQDYWAVDVLRSPVIEFHRGYVEDTSIRPGRVYYADGFFDLDGTWFEKPPAFRLWAASVLKAIRRVTTRHGSVYVAPAALAWSRRTGGSLQEP